MEDIAVRMGIKDICASWMLSLLHLVAERASLKLNSNLKNQDRPSQFLFVQVHGAAKPSRDH